MAKRVRNGEKDVIDMPPKVVQKGKLHEHEGRFQTLTQWAVECGINASTIRTRMRRGETLSEAVSRPVEAAPVTMVELNGKRKPLHVWCHEYEIDLRTCKTRINNGWSIQDALTLPVRGKSKKKEKTHDSE